MRNRLLNFLSLATLLLAPAALADLEVLVDGVQRPEYQHRGTAYIEAIRGREYSLRITNPTGHRVAVALAVDGLNTIDAKHTSGWNASKWVLEPYGSTVISGWQVSDSSARRFFFTGERQSYGAQLGATENLGVIEAVFYRERQRPVRREIAGGVLQPAPAAAPRLEEKSRADDDYAATGMGDSTRHEVERVAIELDPQPIETARIRYEFRPELVRLGILGKSRDPLERREKARGFEYCPVR